MNGWPERIDGETEEHWQNRIAAFIKLRIQLTQAGIMKPEDFARLDEEAFQETRTLENLFMEELMKL